MFKESQTIQNYCCPAPIDIFGSVGWQEKKLVFFDAEGRIKKVSKVLQCNRDLCEEINPVLTNQIYQYDQMGLVSEVNSEWERILFHYLKK